MAAVNPRAAAQVALVAKFLQKNGPAIVSQLQAVMDERQGTAGRAAGATGPTVRSEARPAGGTPGAAGTAGAASASRAHRPSTVGGQLAAAALGVVAGQAQKAAGNVGRALQSKSPEAKLERKLTVLTELIDEATPGTPLAARALRSRQQVDALRQKRDLVLKAWTGKKRTNALKELNAAADDLIDQFLAAVGEPLA